MNKLTAIAAIVLMLGSSWASPQGGDLPHTFVAAESASSVSRAVNTVQFAAQRAVQTHPEVQYRWALLQAARSEQDVARGALRPRLDAMLDTGRHWRADAAAGSVSFNQHGGSLIATQLLWDGESTRGEVSRLGHLAQARYFEFVDAATSVATETVRAHLDVMRYRELVGLVTASYDEHKRLFDQINDRVKAGAGRRVDLDQATGRLALAESNVRTELANLHDVSVRYLRIVGVAPARDLVLPDVLSTGFAEDLHSMTNLALRRNAAYLASVKSMDAMNAQVERAQAGLNPRVELRARTDRHRVNDFGREPSASTAVEMVLSMNLYRGGSDHATIRQHANLLIAARELRDKNCRDIQQVLAIAHNDVLRLQQQIANLEQHRQSTEVVRRAYRQQFDIGQRSLLDLLDTENELLVSSRAAVEGRYNLQQAHLRLHAAAGTLLSILSISRQGFDDSAGIATTSPDIAANCPTVAVAQTMALASPAGLVAGDHGSSQRLPSGGVAVAQAVSPPEAAMLNPVRSRAVPPADVPIHTPAAMLGTGHSSAYSSGPAVAMNEEPRLVEPASAGSPESFVDHWMTAWESKNFQRYVASYSPRFDPTQGHYTNGKPAPASSRAEWVAQRKRALSKPGVIEIERLNTSLIWLGQNRVQVSFEQRYLSDNYSDTVMKTLELERETGGPWQILRESSQPLPATNRSIAGAGSKRKA